MADYTTTNCYICKEPIEIPAAHADDGPFKHDDCDPWEGEARSYSY